MSEPIQYGLDADSARKWGTYASSPFRIGIAFSGERMPQCTWMPKICSWRAIHWLRSTRVA